MIFTGIACNREAILQFETLYSFLICASFCSLKDIKIHGRNLVFPRKFRPPQHFRQFEATLNKEFLSVFYFVYRGIWIWLLFKEFFWLQISFVWVLGKLLERKSWEWSLGLWQMMLLSEKDNLCEHLRYPLNRKNGWFQTMKCILHSLWLSDLFTLIFHLFQ